MLGDLGESDVVGLRVGLLWMRTGPYHLARARGGVEFLGAAGASVSVVQVSARDHYAWTPTGPASEVPLSTLFTQRAYGELPSAEIASRVVEWLEDQRVDVVASNGWAVPEARAALAWAGRSSRRRAVVMSETKADEAPRVFWKEWIKRALLRNADAGLVGGEMQARYLASLGVARERIFLGYNAVDNEYFERGAMAARDARAAGLDAGPLDGRPYFFAIARFIARKNFDGLLRAYAAYRRAAGANAWALVISGSGEEESALKQLSAELQLDADLHWAGFLQYPDLPRWYAHAGAFIHPAKGEPWGLVVNEAAACGLPLLVAAPVGARYELVEDGVNGRVFDPCSDAEITRVLLEIAEASDSERQAMGQAAQRRVADYGPRRFGEGLLAAVRAAWAVKR